MHVGQLSQIAHVVVLMLENRSFDSMLGKLYPNSEDFEGLDGTEKNLDPNGVSVSIWRNTGTDEATMRIPNPDPGELWDVPWEDLSKTISSKSKKINRKIMIPRA
jgi:phospholipase C